MAFPKKKIYLALAVVGIGLISYSALNVDSRFGKGDIGIFVPGNPQNPGGNPPTTTTICVDNTSTKPATPTAAGSGVFGSLDNGPTINFNPKSPGSSVDPSNSRRPVFVGSFNPRFPFEPRKPTAQQPQVTPKNPTTKKPFDPSLVPNNPGNTNMPTIPNVPTPATPTPPSNPQMPPSTNVSCNEQCVVNSNGVHERWLFCDNGSSTLIESCSGICVTQ